MDENIFTKLASEATMEVLKPLLKALGTGALERLKKGIDSVRSKRRENNLRHHMEKINSEIVSSREQVPAEPPPKQLELFYDCAEHMQDVDAEDTELSQLWEQLTLRIVLGEHVSVELIRALKDLSPGEAHLLLRLYKKPTLRAHWVGSVFYRWPQKESYYLKSLQRKQMVERSYARFTVIALLLLITFGGLSYHLYMTQSWKWVPLVQRSTRVLLVFNRLAWFGVPIFLASTFLVQLRLSWLGKALVKSKTKQTTF